MSILVVVIIILGGIGSLRGVVIGAFAVQYVNQTLLRCLGDQLLNRPDQLARRSTGIELLRDFNLVNYNYLIFGIVLAIMMIRRPEGLFPVETAKAEMHGIGIAAEVSAATADELAVAEEILIESRRGAAGRTGRLPARRKVIRSRRRGRAAGRYATGLDPENDLPEDTR